MKILSIYPLPGISYAHDANVAVVSDQDVLFAAEEERFLRGQHSIGHGPDRATLLGLKSTGLDPSDLDRLVVTSLETCCRRPDYQRRLQFVREQFLVPDTVRACCVPHHLAHTALAVLTSPFDECLFLTLDAGGDGEMGHWGTFRKGRFHIIERIDLSPAHLYQFLTCISGFPLFEEGKVMGLAAYGDVDSRLLAWLRQHFWIKPRGASLQTDLTFRWRGSLDLARVDADRFARHKYLRWHLDFRAPGHDLWIGEIPPPDIAKTAQSFFQDLLGEIASNLIERTGIHRLACSGGGFLNVAATGHIPRVVPGADLYVPVAPHDAGLALGAALWTQHRFRRPRPAFPVSPLLGPRFAAEEVERVLGDFGIRYERPDDLSGTIARLLGEGTIVGWFDGPAEYGPRALGARSVLADPRNRGAKARLNQLLKKRDWFMPFAPSVLEEHGAALFEDFKPSPYMNVAFRASEAALRLIPAAVHADGTCRAHSVTRIANPRYHALISRFHEMTGVPAVLNTSFNRHGLPMVATPRDAVLHLLEGCVDVLAIEGFLVDGRARARELAAVDEQDLLDVMLLRHAAALAASGRGRLAREVLSRVDTHLTEDDGTFLYRGERVWASNSPVRELEEWWASKGTRTDEGR
jgi:carbamoyltransferase